MSTIELGGWLAGPAAAGLGWLVLTLNSLVTTRGGVQGVPLTPWPSETSGRPSILMGPQAALQLITMALHDTTSTDQAMASSKMKYRLWSSNHNNP